jgi:hypothetical protein
MIAWTCIIAGGADDGKIILGWYPRGCPEQLSLKDSTGTVCRAVLVSFDQEFSYALFRHENASPRQLMRAEAALKALVEKLHHNASPVPTPGKRNNPKVISVLVARIFTEARAGLAAVQGTGLPGHCIHALH